MASRDFPQPVDPKIAKIGTRDISTTPNSLSTRRNCACAIAARMCFLFRRSDHVTRWRSILNVHLLVLELRNSLNCKLCLENVFINLDGFGVRLNGNEMVINLRIKNNTWSCGMVWLVHIVCYSVIY